jgi:hypothetical protein
MLCDPETPRRREGRPKPNRDFRRAGGPRPGWTAEILVQNLSATAFANITEFGLKLDFKDKAAGMTGRRHKRET